VTDEATWTTRQKLEWRVGFAGKVTAIVTVCIAGLLWLFGLQTKAEAQAQRATIESSYKAADDAVKVWASDQDKLVQTRLDGISQRINDQSQLLTEIRDLVLRDKGRR